MTTPNNRSAKAWADWLQNAATVERYGTVFLQERERRAIVECLRAATQAAPVATTAQVQEDAARYRKIRAGRSDYHGDCYAMSFQPDGDEPLDGEELDRTVDAMRAIDTTRQASSGHGGEV